MRLFRLRQATIAVVHGHCYGGGLQIALGADIRLTAADAKWSIREVHWGLVPDMGITASLPRLMPIDKAHPLEDTSAACVEHARVTGLAPLWAVTLLAGVNDSEEDARAFAALALRFTRDAGRAPRISVIPYNRIGDDAADPFRRTSEEAQERFRATMHAAGAFTHRRYSGGSDVAAACGQLAARA